MAPTLEDRRKGGSLGEFKSGFGAPPTGGWFSFAEDSIENKRLYCEKHGYSFFLANDLLDDVRYINATIEFDRIRIRSSSKRKKIGTPSDETQEEGSSEDRVKIVRLNVKRKPSWLKVKAVERYLASGDYDWVFWIDGDTIIMNDNIQLESFLPEEPYLEKSSIPTVDTEDRRKNERQRTDIPSLILTKDHRGINAGVWFIRRSEWSMKFLGYWWNLGLKERFLRRFRMKGPTDTIGRSGDQDAMVYAIEKIEEGTLRLFSNNTVVTGNSEPVPAIEMNESRFIRYLPQCSFNSYFELKSFWGVFMDGDFLCHFAGHFDRRTQLMNAFFRGYIYAEPNRV